MNSSGRGDGSIVIAGIGLLLAVLMAVTLSFLSDHGKPFPMSSIFVLPFVFGSIGLLPLVGLFALTYFGWLRPMTTGKVQFTKWTWAGFIVLVALSASWYWSGWSYGVRWQGRAYTLGCSIVGALLSLGAAIAGLVGRKLRSPDAAAFARWLVLLWALTYGYPLLGGQGAGHLTTG